MLEDENPDKKTQTNEPEANWAYSQDSPDPIFQEAENNLQTSFEPVSWTASEYIAHEKTALWYVVVSLLMIVFAGLIYFFDSDNGLFSPILVLIAGIIFMVAASRKPNELEYLIDRSGLHIGKKLYNYAQFKSFSLVQEGLIVTIVFTPLQRFVPALTIYFDPNDQDKIVTALSEYLPVENKKLDIIDSLMRKIRF